MRNGFIVLAALAVLALVAGCTNDDYLDTGQVVGDRDPRIVGSDNDNGTNTTTGGTGGTVDGTDDGTIGGTTGGATGGTTVGTTNGTGGTVGETNWTSGSTGGTTGTARNTTTGGTTGGNTDDTDTTDDGTDDTDGVDTANWNTNRTGTGGVTGPSRIIWNGNATENDTGDATEEEADAEIEMEVTSDGVEITDEQTIEEGDTVMLTVMSTGGDYGVRIPDLDVNTGTIDEGEEETITFTADESGDFDVYCIGCDDEDTAGESITVR